MELPNQLKRLALDLENWISEDEISILAIESGYEIRESPLRGYNFLILHLLGAMDNGMSSSLTQLCAHASSLGVHVVNKSLDGRYTCRASLFMSRVCQHLLSKRLGDKVSLDVLNLFEGIYVSDATNVELPSHLSSLYKGIGGSASSASLKLDCTFDLKSDWSRFTLKAGCSGDQTRIFGAPKKSLWLRDLGYYKTDDFIGLDRQGAFFISRARMDISLYSGVQGSEKLDLVALIEELKINESINRTVWLGAKQRHPVRLVVQRVPDAVATKKRQKLTKEKKAKGRKVSERRLQLCALNIYITNLDTDTWSADQIHQLYKIRWQIELIFKIWKSELHLEKVPKMKKERFECQLYALLIYLILNHRLVQSFKDYYWNEEEIELSEIKLSKIIQVHNWNIKKIIIGMANSALAFIEIICSNIKKLARKDIRLKNKNPLFHMC